MDNNSSNTNTSGTANTGTSKGRRFLGSDPSLAKLHDVQLKEVEITMRRSGAGKEKEDRPSSRIRSRSSSSERVPSRQYSSSKAKKIDGIPARVTQSSHHSLKSKQNSAPKLKEEEMNTTFLNELNLYMQQAKYSADEADDGSEEESDSAGSLLKRSSSIDVKDSDLELKSNKEPGIGVKKSVCAMRVSISGPPLSDISVEDENSESASTDDASERDEEDDDDESDDDYSDKAQKCRMKPKGKVNALSVSTMVPKVDSTILKNISVSKIDKEQVKKYLNECGEGEGSVASESLSSGSSISQNKVSYYRHNNSTARQLNTVNVPELTQMIQQIPKIINFDKTLPAVKKSLCAFQSGKKELGTAPSYVADLGSVGPNLKSKRSEHTNLIVSRSNSPAKQFRYQLVEANSTTSKRGSIKSTCDRTTIKLTHLNPEEMPSAMLKSMVEGVVAVTEPEFELNSTLRFPTKSLYVLFKSEDAANKAMIFLKESNIQCDFRTIE